MKMLLKSIFVFSFIFLFECVLIARELHKAFSIVCFID